METFSDGLTFGLGIAAAIALCLFAAIRLRRFRASYRAWRFSQAGFTYEQNRHVTGWLSRDPDNDEWILWDETHNVTLRSADGDASWRVSRESMRECLSIGREYERRSRAGGQPTQCINLTDLRRDLASAKLDPDLYNSELEPLLARWEAQYGDHVPIREVESLQQLAAAKIDLLEFRRQQIVNREAKKGATIELDAIRRRLNGSKETYAGPDREAYVRQVDALLQSLAAKYGSRIPVDDAYEIMKKLEAGVGLN